MPRSYQPGPIRLPDSLADFAARGFSLDHPREQALLEEHARSFLRGFNLALRHRTDVHEALASVPADERGFAYEGAGMYAALHDLAAVGRGQPALRRLLDGPGDRFAHLVHVGYGWPPAPLRRPPGLRLRPPLPATPLLRWLALDGAGFADIYFGGPAALRRLSHRSGRDPRWAARTAGAGRALWFVRSADVGAAAVDVARAPLAARTHLWAGLGLAMAYAGGADPERMSALVTAAGPDRPSVLQGVMFAAAARVRAGHVPDHTGSATRILLGVEPAVAAAWTDEAADGLTDRPDVAAYLLWTTRLRARATSPVTS